MTYRDSGRWRLPARSPQHASPFGYSAPVRRHAHRALRLFVTAGTWAAGLCLVIGSIVLVATAAGPERAQPDLTAARQASPRAGLASKAPAKVSGHGTTGSGQVVAAFSGRGNLTTGHFRVRPHARWELRWSYSCPAGITEGQLVVADAGASGHGGASIDQTGISGAGSIWLGPGKTTHYLVVISTCSWSMKAVQAK
jgi:hypothetical protein